MRSAESWFGEYSENHRNATNIAIHWVCVPAIFFSVIGLLGSIPPGELPWLGRLPWAKLVIGLVLLLFYARLSLRIASGMAMMSYAALVLARWLDDHAPWPLWAVGITVFVVAWLGQFYGHKVEGKKPSFLKDLAFLLIGPAWLVGKALKKAGVNY